MALVQLFQESNGLIMIKALTEVISSFAWMTEAIFVQAKTKREKGWFKIYSIHPIKLIGKKLWKGWFKIMVY